MLFKARVLDGIANGTVDLAFRAWAKSSVREGSTFRSPIGMLKAESVDQVVAGSVSEGEALRAGYASRESLLKDLKIVAESYVFRIRVSRAGVDERITLRESIAGDDEIKDIAARLDRFDRASTRGDWTRATLRLIEAQPGVRAGNLAVELGLETVIFKRQVRRLKELGLTESLEVGYRLSPRGKAVLSADTSQE